MRLLLIFLLTACMISCKVPNSYFVRNMNPYDLTHPDTFYWESPEVYKSDDTVNFEGTTLQILYVHYSPNAK